jgi:putative transposase
VRRLARLWIIVHDQLATGNKIRVLTVVDTFSRYVPVLDPRFSYRAEDVVQTLEKICLGSATRGRSGGPGSEFVSRDLDLWAYTRGVTLDFSRPGKPTDNAYIEAFNGRFRAERLNTHWFLTLADARKDRRSPHGASGHKVPISLQNSRWRYQPAAVKEAGKLQLPAIQ